MNKHNRKVEKLLDVYLRVTKSKMLLESKQEQAKKWLNQRKMNASARKKKRDSLLRRPSRNEDFEFGHMYFFSYNAKTKKELPYWDQYPLVIPFSKSGGLTYAINIHYLPPRIRAGIIDLFAQKDGILVPMESTVKAMSKNPIFKPAIHSYYRGLVVGEVHKIEPEEWQDIIFLPLAKFRSDKQGSSAPSLGEVYKDYYNKIDNYS